MSEPTRYSETFSPASVEDWRKTAEASLKGRPLDKLISKTLDGLDIHPLYTAADRDGASSPQLRDGEAAGAWDICQTIAHPLPTTANAELLEDLSRGASGAVLRLDTRARLGDTHADPGTDGIAAATIADFITLLKGAEPDIHGIFLDAGVRGLAAAAMVLAVAEEAEMPIAALDARLNIDPAGALAAAGALPMSRTVAEAGLAAAAKLASGADNHLRAVGVDTRAYHNAGATEVQEIAVALATATEYLRTLTKAGLAPADAAKITFTFAIDADVFLSIAKLRAFRKGWAQVLNAVFPGNAPETHEILAVTSERMMSKRDVTVNMLRTTAATFASAVGGANAVCVLPYTARHGLPAEHARRIARNTQIILEQESNLARVADPAAGSYALETLTDDLAKAGWAAFQAIEAEGGIFSALEAGTLQSAIAEKTEARRKAIASRKLPLTGVSEFPAIDEARVETEHSNQERAAALIAEATTAAESDAGAKAALADIDPASADLMTGLIAAARAGATVAQITEHLSGDGPSCAALAPHLLDEDFERLRVKSDELLAVAGARPTVFLATIGTPADFTSRATFAKAFFEAGGIEALMTDGFATPEDAAAAFAESGAPLAVLCSSDALYAERGAAFAHAVKNAGARTLYFAGRPGDMETSLSEAGVDEFVFVGSNVAATLARAYDVIGGNQ